MSKTCNEIGRNIKYILNAYVGAPPNLKLGVCVTQTSVVAVVAEQSTHAIYHIQVN